MMETLTFADGFLAGLAIGRAAGRQDVDNQIKWATNNFDEIIAIFDAEMERIEKTLAEKINITA